MKLIYKDKLRVEIFDTRSEMGHKAATDVTAYIGEALNRKDELNIIFASAPSQNEFLAALLQSNIDWTRINAFHMDEYLELPADAPQRFGNFLRQSIFGKVPFKSVHYFEDEGATPIEVCRHYKTLLEQHPADIVFMGIGENGHIAFNDPHVAFFNDPERVKIVELDETCRRQQVNDGCFAAIDEVPLHAYTLTIPALMAARKIFCIVPARTKAKAVRDTIQGGITEQCPASILRQHPAVTLYCDADSAYYLITDSNTEKI